MGDLNLLILGVGVGALPFVVYLFFRNSLWVLAFHLLSRVVVDSMPGLSYAAVAGGLSFARVYSAAMMLFLLGYLLSRRGFFSGTYGIQVAIFFFVSILSAIYNFAWLGIVETTIKWLYLWLTANLLVLVVKENGEQSVLRVLAFVFIYPLMNQLVFAIIGTPKVGGGQTSYLGSYFHEVSLAYILLMAITVYFAIMISDRDKTWRVFAAALWIWSHAALYFNNYRTAVIALGVWWAIVALFVLPKLSVGRRLIAVGTMVTALSFVVLALGEDLTSKMSGAVSVVMEPEEHFDVSGQARQTEVLSGRVYLWNTYLYEFIDAPWDTKLLGHGPEVGVSVVGTHAHNQFLTALLDLGLLGIVAVLWIMVTMALSVLRQIRKGSAQLVSMGGMVFGIFVMMLATSPFRETRGMLLFGVALGFVAASRLQVRSTLRPHQRRKYDVVDAEQGAKATEVGA